MITGCYSRFVQVAVVNCGKKQIILRWGNQARFVMNEATVDHWVKGSQDGR